MGKKSRVNVYNEDYVELNHAYVTIYKFYNSLLETYNADEDVLAVLREIMLVFNPTLDRIKSEMTVKTRFKEEPVSSESQDSKKAAGGDGSPVILYGKFTGD